MKPSICLTTSLPPETPMNWYVGDSVDPSDLAVRTLPPTRLLLPAVERMIDESWERRETDSAGRQFFDGGLWRYVSHRRLGGKMEISVEPTSFRVYKGTNIDHPEIFEKHGDLVMANPLIVTAFVRSRDGYLLFARRSHQVAIFQGNIHTLGGTVSRRNDKLTPGDVFDAIYDELFEEAAILRSEVSKLVCLQLAAATPHRMRQFVFSADVTLSAAELQRRDPIDGYEHDELLFIPDSPHDLVQFLQCHGNDVASPLRSWLEENVPRNS